MHRRTQLWNALNIRDPINLFIVWNIIEKWTVGKGQKGKALCLMSFVFWTQLDVCFFFPTLIKKKKRGQTMKDIVACKNKIKKMFEEDINIFHEKIKK